MRPQAFPKTQELYARSGIAMPVSSATYFDGMSSCPSHIAFTKNNRPQAMPAARAW